MVGKGQNIPDIFISCFWQTHRLAESLKVWLTDNINTAINGFRLFVYLFLFFHLSAAGFLFFLFYVGGINVPLYNVLTFDLLLVREFWAGFRSFHVKYMKKNFFFALK